MKKKNNRKINFEAFRYIIREPEISMAEKAILVDLLLYAGVNGEAFPSEKTLAKDMGISDRYVRTILKKLKGLEIIGWEKRFNTTNRYVFDKELYIRTNPKVTPSIGNSDSTNSGTVVPDVVGTIIPDSTGTAFPAKDSQLERSQFENESPNEDTREK